MLLFSTSLFAQRNLSGSLTRSLYTYVYRIAWPEARTLTETNMRAVSESYLHSLVDSFKKEEPSLPEGNYLFVKAAKNKLAFKLFTAGDVTPKIINNHRDLVVALHTKEGIMLSGADVSLNKKRLLYDVATQTYRREKYQKDGLLHVVYNGVFYSFPLEKVYRERHRSFFQTIAQSAPLKYVLQPLKKFFGKTRSRRYNFFFRTQNEQRFNGFLVCNKPKYKLGDTVRLKAFVTTAKGEPYSKKLLLRLSVPGFAVDSVIAVLSPYRPGGFEHSFVLSDSLDLDLDEEYLLTLEEEGSRQYNLPDYNGDDKEEYAANRKVVMRGRFQYEEYELNSVAFSARSDKPEHSRGEEPAVYLKASDENGLTVMDGRVQIIVKANVYGTKTFTAPAVFLPDTLWRYEGPLDAVGETRINLPDSIFPQANFSYEVECVFLNSNNERQTQSLYQTFRGETGRIAFDLKDDSLHIDYLVKGVSTTTNGTVYGFTKDGDTLSQQFVQLPAAVKLHPFAERYEAKTGAADEEYEVQLSNAVSAQASRTRDSLFIRLVNPSRLPVWYTVFAGNKVVLRGLSDSLFYAAKTTTPKNYFLSLQYILAGELHNEEYTVPYRDKLLSIAVAQPDAVYPGQKTAVSLTVTDALSRPVPDADVTAWAFTRKFEDARTPVVPYFGKLYPGRKRYASFREGDEKEYENTIRLAWEKWSLEMHLDTVEYYKFLYPALLYVNTEPAPDSLTQLAPFVVKNGALQPVHHLYIDEVPVYFSASQDLQRYSFAVSPGKHALRLRTRNSLVVLDSFVVKGGVKTILSINADTANHLVRMQKMPDTLTAYEQGLWSKYMLVMEKTFGENYAYISNGERLFFLPPNDYRRSLLICPLPYTHGELVVKNKFSQPFEAEGNYHYSIGKGLVKQKVLASAYPFSASLSGAEPAPNFRDYVLTAKEIDSLWQGYLYSRSASTDLFLNPTLSKEGNGALQIGLKKDSSGKPLFIRHIFVFKYDDPGFLCVYRGDARDLGYLPPDKYRLFFLLKEDGYFIRDSIAVKQNGINYYEITPSHIRPKDSVSSRISAIVNAKERSGYWQSDFNRIKETFNKRYFDESQLTETISGTVRDKDGLPVYGASVFLKGTNIGTMTNAAGEFSLNTVRGGTLVVSSVGYEVQEVKAKAAGNYRVLLKQSSMSLQEAVIVGYATGVRRELSASVSGVQIDGNGGAAPSILIRGINTTDSNRMPLLIVDGLPYSGRMEDIDPSTIANTTVLKEDAAVAIYGQRAINGVVVITTKNPASTITGAFPQPGGSLRRNFRDYAYWQPTLRTDAEGKTSFNVIYPDDITAWRTFAVAVTGRKQSGYAEGLVRSFKAISGALSLPQFAVQGDSVNMIGKALNYGMDSIEANRRFYINDTLAKESALRFRNAWIDSFGVVAPAGDSLKLKYTVQKQSGYFDGEERTIPVFRPGVQETSGLFAALRSDTAFTVQPLSDTGTLKIYAESSALPVLEKEIESLQAYEYLCNEQLASKLKGLLVQKKIDSFLKRPFRSEKNVRELIAKLSQSKSAAGLWGWWKEGEPTAWISLHVLEALTNAAANGYATPLDKTTATDYLLFHLQDYDPGEALSALHLLRLLDAKLDYGRNIDSLKKRPWKMSLYEKLRLVELEQKTNLPYSLDAFLAAPSHTMFGNVYWGEEGYRFFDNSVQNTLAMYRILKAEGGHEDLLEKMRGYFMESRKSGSWRNTYESSLILETILPHLLVNDSLPKTATLTLSGGVQQTVEHFPFTTEIKTGQPMLVRKEGGLPVYFTAYQQRWNATPQKASENFAVQTSFEKAAHRLTALKAGEPVTLKISVSVKADADYVLVEAPIPAGCSYNSKAQPYGNNEVHREHFKNKVSIFCSELKKGEYTFTVSLLPRYTGRYTLNPAKAEMMYFPVFYGREEMKRVVIE